MGDGIRVLVADDHAIVRDGIKAAVGAVGDISVVGEAENGKEAVSMTRELTPDIVIMDIGMPVLNGIEATRQITKAFPGAKVLILTMHNDDKYIFQSLKAGATGYVLKGSGMAELIDAIRSIHSGNPYFSPPVSRKIMESYLSDEDTKKKGGRSEILTGREREVLQLIAEGYSNLKTAELIGISPKTVETHRSNIMKKLGVHDVAGLVKYAIKQGIIIF
jgi:two-component system, NarL family, response regulator NreC